MEGRPYVLICARGYGFVLRFVNCKPNVMSQAAFTLLVHVANSHYFPEYFYH